VGALHGVALLGGRVSGRVPGRCLGERRRKGAKLHACCVLCWARRAVGGRGRALAGATQEGVARLEMGARRRARGAAMRECWGL